MARVDIQCAKCLFPDVICDLLQSQLDPPTMGFLFSLGIFHGLNTNAAIRISKELIRFVFWMLEHKIPTNVLGILPVESVRGKLPTGFAIWWNKYTTTTSTPDISVSPDDFSEFDEFDDYEFDFERMLVQRGRRPLRRGPHHNF